MHCKQNYYLKIQKQRFTNGLDTRCSQKFRKFHWKNTCVGVSFKKTSGPQACKFIKKRLQHRYFPVKLAIFSRALFLQNTSGGSFLKQATVTFCSKISQGYLLPQLISYNLQLSQWQIIFKNAFTCQTLVPIERFCSRFRTNLKGFDLNINNFAVLLHFQIT